MNVRVGTIGITTRAFWEPAKSGPVVPTEAGRGITER
jgi:hypothetical protein